MGFFPPRDDDGGCLGSVILAVVVVGLISGLVYAVGRLIGYVLS
jgi:hypothetical protein